MNDFVEECRREWRRLGVADSLAEEMAADLATDLEEAKAEGVSAEELLGSSASEPRSFAATWATERGIIPTPSSSPTARRRRLILTTFTAVAGIAVIFAALALLTGQPKTSVVAVNTHGTHNSVAPAGSAFPPTTGRRVLLHASAAAPVEWILLFLGIIALGFAAWLWTSWRPSRSPSVPAST